jgi:hypothetical protein
MYSQSGPEPYTGFPTLYDGPAIIAGTVSTVATVHIHTDRSLGKSENVGSKSARLLALIGDFPQAWR